jgi:hypothetical protein
MALRSVALTDTLETFRTTFNSLGTDVGDVATLSGVTASTVVGAINELASEQYGGFTISDSASNVTQSIGANDNISFAGDSNITIAISDQDTVTYTLNTTITGISSITSTTFTDGTATLTGGSLTGLTSLDATTITEDSVRIATRPFAIAQAVALG